MVRSQELDDESDDEGSKKISHSFALELAYIIENYSNESEAEAMGILDLYLYGADSITLAVGYAQRQSQHSARLWDELIDHCLSKSSTAGGKAQDGILFGALLEAAALSGADLARLVSRIPEGMVVEGLRPRLVAAVADYRFKLDIHEAASLASSAERDNLLRELNHRSRRGARYQLPTTPRRASPKTVSHDAPIAQNGEFIMPPFRRPRERRDRHSIGCSFLIR